MERPIFNSIEQIDAAKISLIPNVIQFVQYEDTAGDVNMGTVGPGALPFMVEFFDITNAPTSIKTIYAATRTLREPIVERSFLLENFTVFKDTDYGKQAMSQGLLDAQITVFDKSHNGEYVQPHNYFIIRDILTKSMHICISKTVTGDSPVNVNNIDIMVDFKDKQKRSSATSSLPVTFSIDDEGELLRVELKNEFLANFTTLDRMDLLVTGVINGVKGTYVIPKEHIYDVTLNITGDLVERQSSKERDYFKYLYNAMYGNIDIYGNPHGWKLTNAGEGSFITFRITRPIYDTEKYELSFKSKRDTLQISNPEEYLFFLRDNNTRKLLQYGRDFKYVRNNGKMITAIQLTGENYPCGIERLNLMAIPQSNRSLIYNVPKDKELTNAYIDIHKYYVNHNYYRTKVSLDDIIVIQLENNGFSGVLEAVDGIYHIERKIANSDVTIIVLDYGEVEDSSVTKTKAYLDLYDENELQPIVYGEDFPLFIEGIDYYGNRSTFTTNNKVLIDKNYRQKGDLILINLTDDWNVDDIMTSIRKDGSGTIVEPYIQNIDGKYVVQGDVENVGVYGLENNIDNITNNRNDFIDKFTPGFMKSFENATKNILNYVAKSNGKMFAYPPDTSKIWISGEALVVYFECTTGNHFNLVVDDVTDSNDVKRLYTEYQITPILDNGVYKYVHIITHDGVGKTRITMTHREGSPNEFVRFWAIR